MRQFLAFLSITFLFFSCEKSEVSTPERQRLAGYRYVYTDANKKDVYSGVYSYDQNHNLISEAQNDTTYQVSTGQIVPVKTTHQYFYNDEGFLSKKTSEALSIRLTANTEITYDYRNGMLSLEDFGNNVREYRYNSEGKLTTAIFTSKTSGNKTVVDYDDYIPLDLVKTNDGFLFVQENEKTYLDNDLLLKRYEKFDKGMLVFEQDYTLQKSGLPQSLLPNFKGFPKIKASDYRKGIEREIVTYRTIDGDRTLSDQRSLTPEFDQNSNLVRNSGHELINQETENPTRRELLFEYYYESY